MSLLSKLTQLVISNNNLTGGIPPFLGNITSMEVFSAVTNPLGGSSPDTLGLWKSLTVFASGGCNLYGSIPHSIFNLSLLVTFSSSENHLTGSLPSEIGNQLPNLEYLQLRDNELTGVLPPSISNCSKLGRLEMGRDEKADDLRFINSLKNCTRLVVLDLYNCNLTGVLPVSIGLVDCISRTTFKSKGYIFQGMIPSSLSSLGGLGKKRSSQPSQSSGNERFLKVSYNELLKATDGFSTENLIGDGGFSSVYKGILDFDDDRFVAVKVLHLQNRGALKSFLAECEAWRNIRHLVHDWLHSSANKSKLNLLQRINILSDVATALDYLHIRCETTIVHGDLKPSKHSSDVIMVAYVGDFGLARLLGTDLNQNSSTGVKGTIGYAPPEYGMGNDMTSSGDVYSFGILLLELMTGKKPTDDMFNEGLSIHTFASMALPDHVTDVIDGDAIVLQSKEVNAKKVEECLAATIKIGVSCSMDSPLQRMKIEIVVNELQRILNILEFAHDGDKSVAELMDTGRQLLGSLLFFEVGSHCDFIEVNPCLIFDRRKAYGMSLNIPAGTATRFEPGDAKSVTLVRIGGNQVIRGDISLLIPAPLPPKIYPSGPVRASRSTSAREEVKGFELVVVSSHACLAAVALLCLRKYGVRKFLFVDQSHGHVQRFSKDYVLKIDVSSIAQVVGVILCLNAAAKISHRAQGIAALASRWHALASCGPDDRSHMRFSHSNRNLEAASSLMRLVSSESDMEAMNYVPLPTNAQLTSYLSSYHRRQSFRKYK
ncbi:leucine-rich repeat protein [Tanacetum coccineum]